MERVEITSLSSRGQVVIPQDIRNKLKLEIGEKFIVVGEEDMIILKKVQRPSFKDFNKIINKTQEFARKKNLKPIDIGGVIKRIRQ